MERIGKIKTIYRAFFKKSDIDQKILSDRRKECKSCPFNSYNANRRDLSAFNKLRILILQKEYCVICGCFIREKTASVTEACALEYRNQTPLWNRLILERPNKKKMNLINKSEDIVNPSVNDEGEIILNLGDIERIKLRDIEFDLQVNSNLKFEIVQIFAGCASCTKLYLDRKDDKTYSAKLWLDWSKLSGVFVKDVIIYYVLDEEKFEQRIKLRGNIIN